MKRDLEFLEACPRSFSWTLKEKNTCSLRRMRSTLNFDQSAVGREMRSTKYCAVCTALGAMRQTAWEGGREDPRIFSALGEAAVTRSPPGQPSLRFHKGRARVSLSIDQMAGLCPSRSAVRPHIRQSLAASNPCSEHAYCTVLCRQL